MSQIEIAYDEIPQEPENYLDKLRGFEDAVRQVMAEAASSSSVRWRCDFDEQNRPHFRLLDYSQPGNVLATVVSLDLNAAPDVFKELLAKQIKLR